LLEVEMKEEFTTKSGRQRKDKGVQKVPEIRAKAAGLEADRAI